MSYSISLNSENYYKEIRDHINNTIFLKVWDTWCPHCQAFQKTWDNLINSSDLMEKIIFADINCAENEKLCDSLPGSGTPRFYLFEENQTEPKEYLGPHSFASISRYLKGIISPSIQKISKTELKDVLEESSQPVFIFRFESESNKKDIAQKAISMISYRPFRAFYIDADHKSSSLFVHNKNRSDIYFSGSFEISQLKQFVQDRSITPETFFGPVTENIIKSYNSTVAVLTFNMSDESIFPLINNISHSLEQHIPIVTCYCRVYKPFCDRVGIKDKSPSITIVNNVIESFWKYKGDMSDLKAIQIWVNRVLKGEIESDESKIMKSITHFMDYLEENFILYLIIIVIILCTIFIILFKLLINKKLKSE